MKKRFVVFCLIFVFVLSLVPNFDFAYALSIADNEEIFINADQSEFVSYSGSWSVGGLALPNGTSYAKYATSKNASAVWYPKLDKVSNVNISYLRIYGTGSKENPSLKVTIYADGKTAEKTIDFTNGAPGWVDLGNYNFSGEKNEYVKITGSDNCFTRATSLRLRKGVFSDSASKENVLFGTDEDICRRLGMISGDDNGNITEEYLSKTVLREKAAVYYLKLLGLEEDVLSFSGGASFSDINTVSADCKKYVEYLYAHPNLNFIDGVKFMPKEKITYADWGKVLLTYLGYESGKDYRIQDVISFAAQLGIALDVDGEFTLRDMTEACTDALFVKLKNGKNTMLGDIIAKTDGICDTSYLSGDFSLSDDLKAKRDTAKNRTRRIIYNNDGNDTYEPYDNYPGDFDVSTVTEPMTRENFLSKRTIGIENTQVDSVFYCTGVFNSYHHRTSGETDVRKRDWSWYLANDGGETDSLETMIDWCNDNDKEIFWSMRMNDVHDAAYSEEQLDKWKREHLDLLMCRKSETYTLGYSSHSWSAVNYAYNEVRQKVYNILKDTVIRYTTDGIELDFTRFPTYFKEVAQGEKIYPENIERMNNLIRSVRRLTEKVSSERNKPILISVYISDSMGFNYEIGLDIKTWLEEDLIDIVTVGSAPGRFQSWEASVKEYAPYDVPLYAGFDPLSDKTGSTKYFPQEAAHALIAGMDGVYVYNIFDPHSDLFNKMGDIDTCGTFNPYYATRFKSTELNTFLKNGVRFSKDLNNCTFFTR